MVTVCGFRIKAIHVVSQCGRLVYVVTVDVRAEPDLGSKIVESMWTIILCSSVPVKLVAATYGLKEVHLSCPVDVTASRG